MRKKLMLCVLPGVLEVRANPFLCKSELMSEDLPTFERPRKEISGLPSVVQCSLANELLINSDDKIFITSLIEHFRDVEIVTQTILRTRGKKNMSKSDSTLIAIGGGEFSETSDILETFLGLLKNKSDARIVVMTIATNNP